jgi:5-methylcytosine-specific restriction endonuclease McrA
MLRGDKIDPWVVYTFYEWTCCLCNESIDPELMMPDPLSATIEHIIPLSKNGRHVWDNVAPAHKGCNEDNVHHAIIA